MLLTTALTTEQHSSQSEIRVDFEPCVAERTPLVRGVGSLLKILSGRGEALALRGSLQVDGETFSLYLPKAASYSRDCRTTRGRS